jgi:hypothetical protein
LEVKVESKGWSKDRAEFFADPFFYLYSLSQPVIPAGRSAGIHVTLPLGATVVLLMLLLKF